MRTRLLDRKGQITDLNHKTLTRHMNSKIERTRRTRQRGKTCGPKADDASLVISESLDHICAGRLTAQLAPIVWHLAARGELQVYAQLVHKLDSVRVNTPALALLRQMLNPRLQCL